MSKKSDLTVVRPPSPSRPDGFPEMPSHRPVSSVRPSAPTAPATGPTAITPSRPPSMPASHTRPRPNDLTNVRPLASTPPAPPRVQDMTRVRPPELGPTSSMHPRPPQASSPRISVPAAGEINRQVRRQKGGMLALYWAAGIVAMLTAGGILTAMIARGDADAFIQRQGGPAQPPPVVVVAAPQAPAPIETAAPPPVVAEAAKAAPAAPAKAITAIPGTKPGQIVDLQLWKNRPAKEGESSAAQASPNAPQAAAPKPAVAAAPQAPPATRTPSTPPTNTKISTPENDPAVRMARDQLESAFK